MDMAMSQVYVYVYYSKSSPLAAEVGSGAGAFIP